MTSSDIGVVAAVVRREQRLLLCQRSFAKRHGGLWEFPGGKMDPGETSEDAARRELREELDVEVLSCGTTLLSVRDPDSPFVIHFVEVEIVGEPQPIEHEAITWRTAEEAIELPLAPSDRTFVQYCLARGV